MKKFHLLVALFSITFLLSAMVSPAIGVGSPQTEFQKEPFASTRQDDEAILGSIGSGPLEPNQTADLELNKTVTNATPNVGSSVTFTLTLVNQGPDQATGVVVSDALPNGYTLTASTPSQGTYLSGNWNVGTLDVGVNATLQLVATVLATGSYTNYTEVTASSPPDSDSIPGNSSTTEDDDATVVVTPVPVADLELSKTVSSATPYMGSSVTFTLTLANQGPSQATGVVVHDALPNGYTLTGSTPSVGTYAAGDWSVGTLDAGANATLQLVATVLATGTYTNYTEVTVSPVLDPDSTPNNGSTTVEDDEATVTVAPVPAADLELTKIAATTTPQVEGSVIFTLTLVNKGPSLATNVQVRDQLPNGYNTGPLTYVASQGNYTKNTGIWAVGTVNLNTPVTLRITTPVKSSGNYNNYTQVAAVTEHDPDSTPNNGSTTEDDDDTLVMTPIVRADLELSKTVTNATPNVGSSVTFVLTLVNQGLSQTTGVVVHDALPAGYSLITSTPSVGTYTAGNWNVGNMNAASSATLQLVATVLATGPYTNYTEVTASTVTDPDSTPGNNSTTEDDDATVVVTPVAVADLELDKTVTNATPNVGSSVTFLLTLLNKGPSQATGVVVHDALPNGYTLTGSTPSLGTYTSGNWNVGNLNSGSSATLQLVATVQAAGPYTNYSEVIVSPVLDPDSTPNNGSTTEDDDVTVVVTPVGSADLSVVKSGGATATAGMTLTYNLAVANAGPSTANSVVLTDTLPIGMSYNNATGTGWTCTGAGRSMSCNYPSLIIGAAPVVSLTVNVAPEARGVLENKSRVRSSTGDPASINDTSSVFTTVSGVADLELDKTVTNATPNVGTSVTFALTLLNKGPSQATGVVVKDLLSSGYTPTGSTPSQGTYNAVTGEWSGVTLNPLGTATLLLVAQVKPNSLYNNYTEVIASGESDPDSTKNNGSTTEDDDATVLVTPVQIADLELNKTVTNATPIVGSSVTFGLTLVNQGPSQATGVVVKDLLPSGYTLTGSTPSLGTTYNSATGYWNVGALNALGAATLQLTATVQPAGPYNNYTEVTVSPVLDLDSTPGNGSTTEDDDATVVVTPVTVADLELNKTVTNAAPNVGSSVTFGLTLVNQGPSLATGVIVKDLLPSGYTLTGINVGQGGYDSVTGQWSVGNLNPLGTATLQLTATVLPTGTYNNYTEVIASGQLDLDSTPGNNSTTEDDDVLVTVTPGLVADLSVTSPGTPTPVRAGTDLTYSLVVSNAGPSDVPSVVLTDTIPVGTTFKSIAGPGLTCNPLVGSILRCSMGPLAKTSVTVTLIVTVNPATTGSVTNQVQVKAPAYDSNTTNNSKTEVTPVSVEADFGLVKTAATTTPYVGQTAIFTLTLTNKGPSQSTGIQVTDLLPSGYNLAALVATPSQGTYTGATGLWNIGTMLPAAVVRLRLVVPVLPTGLYNNTARVTAFTGIDPITTDNVSTLTVVPIPNANLSITQTDTPDPVSAGMDLTYNLTVSNAGPSVAQAVVLTETIPTGTTYKSVAGGTGWTCNPPAAGKIRCTLASLNANTSASLITVVVTVNSNATGTVSNVVAVKSSTVDMNTANNSNTAVTTIQTVADLAITKTALPNPVAETQLLTYTLTITNNGPSDASNVSMSESIPTTRVTFLSVSVIQGSANCSGTGPVTCNMGAMVKGSVVKIVVLTRARTVSSTPRTATNTATVTTSSTDPNTANNSASQTTSILPAVDLQLSLVSSSPQVQTGSLLTYTLTVTNAGPSNATNLVVTDTLPEEMAYISSSLLPFSHSPHLVVWHLGTLNASGTSQFTLKVQVDSKTQTLINQAAASADQVVLVYANSVDQNSIDAIDSVLPTVAWYNPWKLGQIYNLSSDTVTLVATAADNVGVDRVRFYRWDEPSQTFKDIGYDYTSVPCVGNPALKCYVFTFNLVELNPKLNEIRVRAFDTSDNSSTPPPYLWIYRIAHEIFLPLVRK